MVAVNPDRPDGFTPVGLVNGLSFAGNIRIFGADGGGASIFRGDLVEATDADGYIDVLAVGGPDGILGVFLGMSGVELRSNTVAENLGYYDASALSENLLVCVGTSLLVEGQEDGDTTPLTLAMRYTNVDILATTGNTTTGLSQQEIDSTTQGTDASDPLTILNLVDRPDNQLASVDTTTPNARWICAMNNIVIGGAANSPI